MQYIKFLILILIFSISAYVGILISRKYSYREIELKEWKKILNALKTKIKFTYQPLGEIFKDLSKNTTINISKILKDTNRLSESVSISEAWTTSIDKNNLNINEEDKNIIKGLGRLLRKNRCRRTSK